LVKQRRRCRRLLVELRRAGMRLNMLRPNDAPLPFPWSSQLEGELRELRCHYGSEHDRVLYRRSGTGPWRDVGFASLGCPDGV
jgi:hypothetical protein